MKKIISIINPQQGAGKTALAVNIAACLGILEKKTLLVDCDPLGDATACLLAPETISRPGLYDLLTGRAEDSAVVADTSFDWLKIIPAGSNLFQAEQELFSFPEKSNPLSRKIAAMAEDFEFILIDSPSSLGPLTVCAMAASDSVLIPLPCHADISPSLKTLLPVVASVKKQQRSNLTIAGIVLTHCDDMAEAQAVLSEEVLTGIATVVLNSVVPKTGASSEHLYHDPPVVIQDVMSPVSESYLDLTVELLER